MKLIKPSYEIRTKIDAERILKSIEEAGRTCYKSEDKITEDSAELFVAKLIKSGHHSVLEHESLSVRFVCDRGVSHEIVRHRLASFSQESTRYCDYSKDKFNNELTFIIPCWFEEDLYSNRRQMIWISAMTRAEEQYKLLTQESTETVPFSTPKWSPQEARSILPTSLKTEIVVTANLREWRTIFAQRTSSGAHPQMRELMVPLLAELKEKLPVIFDDL